MNKIELRNKYIEIRRNINKNDRKIADKYIFNKVIKLNEYKDNKLILIYVSLEDEVDTINIINHSFNINKKVAVPKCEKETIKFYYINSIKELRKGKFGVLEPNSNKEVESFNNSICIVPGVTFDKRKSRIGYGGGFYDRFLRNYSEMKIGLCYKQCLCERITNEEHDIKMDKVISN